MSYKSDLINYANREHNLHSLLFNELVRYVGRAKAKILPFIKAIAEEKQIEEVPKLTESQIVDQFNHNLEIEARLKLIHYVSIHSDWKLSKLDLATVWDELITQNPVFGDHQLVYKWLRSIIDDCLKNHLNLVDEQELIDFFKTKIADDSDDSQFKNLSIEGYYCI
ncbi:MAG: hypothetical protein ACK521_04740 [bacterium]|jgi:hypothetical protein